MHLFREDLLWQQQSNQTAGYSGSPCCSTSTSVMEASAIASASPNECVGLLLCHPLPRCATLHTPGTVHWLQTVQLYLAEGEQASIRGPNACPRCLLAGNTCPCSSRQKITFTNHRLRETVPWSFSEVVARWCLMAPASGNQPTCVTQVAGDLATFLKWHNLSKRVHDLIPQPTK